LTSFVLAHPVVKTRGLGGSQVRLSERLGVWLDRYYWRLQSIKRGPWPVVQSCD